MLLLAASTLASPLEVSATPVAFPPVAEWAETVTQGDLSVTTKDGVARVAYTPGTKGNLCSPRVPVVADATVTVGGAVRGEPTLGDVTALHLHLEGDNGRLHTARRRVDVGDVGWDPVDIRATAPSGTTAARLCVEVQMVAAKDAGALLLQPLVVSEVRATSRKEKLPLRKVVLVSVETFRRDHVHAYGYPRETTPNLDRLIAGGTSFDRHWVPAPYTHPSLASLVTGLLPTRLGFVDNTPTVGPDLRTAAQLFAQGGYVTAAFSSQYVLSNRYGMSRGFHYYRNHPNDVPATTLTNEVLPFLDAHADDNLFLWLHYFDPHGPYRPPAAFRQKFTGDALWNGDDAVLTAGRANEGIAAIPQYIVDEGQLERRHYVAGYDGDIAFLDDELGKLWRHLRGKGWSEETLLVVTADHGESMTDHGRYFCHGSLYEHDLHVPMVVWSPGRAEAGRRVDVPTSHVDVLPTMLDYAGLPIPPGLQGVSLKGVKDRRPPGGIPFSLAAHGRAEKLRWAARDAGPVKVIVDRAGRLLEAYDLAADPGETRDVSATKPARDLARRVKEWLDTGAWTPPPTRTQTLDDEDVERLRELGYVE